MRTLTYYVAATLDGFIAGPEGGDPSGEDYMAVTPDLVEFIATHYPETLPGPAREAMGLTEPGQVFDTVVEGRRSYDIGLVGGGRLAHALLPEIDRLVIKLNPSVIGSGTPLFDGDFAPTLFETVGVTSLAGGVQVITCERRA